jgi:hypothetical protein
MARLTVLLKNWQNVLAEGNRVVSGRRARVTGRYGHDSDE